MTRDEHRVRARVLLTQSDDKYISENAQKKKIAQAQVHALLALSAPLVQDQR